MKVKDLFAAFEARGIHEDMDIRIIVNDKNPEAEEFDDVFKNIEIWGYGDESSVEFFVYK